MICLDKSGSIVLDTNNGFFKMIASELVEFFGLLFIGIIIAFFITGSWDLTGIVIVVDIAQNAVVWLWLKYLKPLRHRNRKV